VVSKNELKYKIIRKTYNIKKKSFKEAYDGTYKRTIDRSYRTGLYSP
jgi:hypothetical protein